MSSTSVEMTKMQRIVGGLNIEPHRGRNASTWKRHANLLAAKTATKHAFPQRKDSWLNATQVCFLLSKALIVVTNALLENESQGTAEEQHTDASCGGLEHLQPCAKRGVGGWLNPCLFTLE